MMDVLVYKLLGTSCAVLVCLAKVPLYNGNDMFALLS